MLDYVCKIASLKDLEDKGYEFVKKGIEIYQNDANIGVYITGGKYKKH